MKLTQEEKRIKIAEACGFKVTKSPAGDYYYNPESLLCQDGRVLWDSEELPNYFNDLNAMHTLEKDMQSIIQERYAKKLRVIISEIELDDYNENWHPMTASSAQRAEAFGQTLGLWKEGE